MQSSACRIVRASAPAGRVPSESPRGAAAARASEEEDEGREEGALVEASETSEVEEDNLSDGCCGGSSGAEKPCSCTNGPLPSSEVFHCGNLPQRIPDKC